MNKHVIFGIGACILLLTLALRLYDPVNVNAGALPNHPRSAADSSPLSVLPIYLPFVSNNAYSTGSPLCRLGATRTTLSFSALSQRPAMQLSSKNNVPPSASTAKAAAISRPLSAYLDYLATLRVGWYADFSTSQSPAHPHGIQYAQTISVKQWKWKNGAYVLVDSIAPYAQPYTYTIQPSLQTIKTIAASNPGSLWLIGNEIERRDWQDTSGSQFGQNEILPEVYARAYREISLAIRAVDPTALLANGSIIVPTPLRLQYMTSVWDQYQSLFGEPMPVDVWNIHAYLGPEKRNHWGIDIPAGIDADVGMFYFGGDEDQMKLVNKDFSQLPPLISSFRQWMKDRGQQNKPLIITEFGSNLPDWVMPGQFTPEQIRDSFMYPGLNYVLNQTDPNLGDPADGYRLIQTTYWWSLDYDAGYYDQGEFFPYYNGNLLWSGIGAPTNAPYPMGLSPLGVYWVNYVSSLTTYSKPPTLPCGQ